MHFEWGDKTIMGSLKGDRTPKNVSVSYGCVYGGIS